MLGSEDSSVKRSDFLENIDGLWKIRHVWEKNKLWKVDILVSEEISEHFWKSEHFILQNVLKVWESRSESIWK